MVEEGQQVGPQKGQCVGVVGSACVRWKNYKELN